MNDQNNKLDVLLVRFLCNRHGDATMNIEQMGLLYVGTYAAKNGYKVRIQDSPNLTFGVLMELFKIAN
ncbi:hypothetical protein [Desulfosporosinus sp. BG]|uniref:hypothetical protein n=1 Tax=Desulfosporosinus sp. BG TaxID=1633135 RepID=UPI00083A65F3|nr:hypothetical protein [Desulfosporosinus sp. BG]ODA42964.1 hypothetical protein DSBG_0314 [Desulfosporosinus sp. BG]